MDDQFNSTIHLIRGADDVSQLQACNNNEIDDEGVRLIAEALANNESIHTLKLNTNSITDMGAAYLAEILNENKTITVLELNSNKIQDKGIENLADIIIKNKTLKTLSLNNNPSVLGVALEKFVTVRHNKELKCLQIWGKHIGLIGAKYISLGLQENTTLTELDLTYCNIGEEGMKNIADALNYNKVNVRKLIE
ncbi:unnamed protein product [Rotaria sp. Silwood2]|nr:unnamed protein product [Rotaria sp. Silwood2]